MTFSLKDVSVLSVLQVSHHTALVRIQKTMLERYTNGLIGGPKPAYVLPPSFLWRLLFLLTGRFPPVMSKGRIYKILLRHAAKGFVWYDKSSGFSLTASVHAALKEYEEQNGHRTASLLLLPEPRKRPTIDSLYTMAQ